MACRSWPQSLKPVTERMKEMLHRKHNESSCCVSVISKRASLAAGDSGLAETVAVCGNGRFWLGLGQCKTVSEDSQASKDLSREVDNLCSWRSSKPNWRAQDSLVWIQWWPWLEQSLDLVIFWEPFKSDLCCAALCRPKDGRKANEDPLFHLAKLYFKKASEFPRRTRRLCLLFHFLVWNSCGLAVRVLWHWVNERLITLLVSAVTIISSLRLVLDGLEISILFLWMLLRKHIKGINYFKSI